MFGIGLAIFFVYCVLFCFVRPDKKGDELLSNAFDGVAYLSGILMATSLCIWLYRVMP